MKPDISENVSKKITVLNLVLTFFIVFSHFGLYFYKYNNALFMHLNVDCGDNNQHIKFVQNTIVIP